MSEAYADLGGVVRPASAVTTLTADEALLIGLRVKALQRVETWPGSGDLNFLRNVRGAPPDRLTAAQHRLIARLAWRYRAQLPAGLRPALNPSHEEATTSDGKQAVPNRSSGDPAVDSEEVLMDSELLHTIARRCHSIIDTANYIAAQVKPRRTVRFCYFTVPHGEFYAMPTIKAPDVVTSLKFGLVGVTPHGDTFVEPIVAVTTGTGTATLEPSVQGQPDANGNVPFTTQGTFTPAAGFTGPVVISAEVQGVDDQDASFNVVPAPSPETVAFDPGQFVAA